MNVLEMLLILVFVVPIVAGCVLFVLCADYLQMQEDQSTVRKHGLAESA
ncbi:MAG: hypothetical protein IKU73_08545 [Clostridia bacterium]|nr:hypothetical protein [Clostridia bacterium]